MNELYHHGIKGMHWGVRRYQNLDGTLTAAGKNRTKSKSSKRKRPHLTKNQKDALKLMAATGAVIGVEVLALHAADKIIDDYYDKQSTFDWEDYQRRAEQARERARNYYQQQQQNSQNTSNRSSGSSYQYSHKSTADTKSSDRTKKYEHVNLDPKKTQARVDELRDKVARAQKDGTVTAEMIDELQEAMAQNKVAKSRMAHSLGYICRINHDTDSLYHHGIKGMKWGVRRYQNPDGSLTAIGKRREKDKADKQARQNSKRQREWNAKNSSQLSDEELTTQIIRLQKEKQLRDLTNEVVSPGKKHAKDLMRRYGDQLLTAVVTTGVTVFVTKKMNDKWNPQKSAYDRMKEEWDAKTRLADEGMPINAKGYKRVNKQWVPKEDK